MKRKAAFESGFFSLFPLYFEREMASGFIQALSGTSNSFCDFFFNKTVFMLIRKTLRWHAVIHVRTKGHPISNLADFEKELAKRTRINFGPRATRGDDLLAFSPVFWSREIRERRGIIASDAEIKPCLKDRRQTKNKVITPTNHEQVNQRAMNRPVFQATTCKRGNNHAYKMQEDGANFLSQSPSLAIVTALNSARLTRLDCAIPVLSRGNL